MNENLALCWLPPDKKARKNSFLLKLILCCNFNLTARRQKRGWACCHFPGWALCDITKGKACWGLFPHFPGAESEAGDRLPRENMSDFCHHTEALTLNRTEMCTDDSRPTVTTPHIFFSSNEGNRQENNSFWTDFGLAGRPLERPPGVKDIPPLIIHTNWADLLNVPC